VVTNEAPVFSLHAVVGAPVSSTIQLHVRVGAVDFTTLIDTRSTHNFIGVDAARWAGLPIEPHPRLTATVANGEHVACPRVLCQATVLIDEMAFGIDLYVMPLVGYDVVLGTHCMATLGDIVWNLAASTMAFKQVERDVCWRGVATPSPPRPHTTDTTELLLDEVFDSFSDVFVELTSLPLECGHNHHIVLKPSVGPVAVCPYK
jgi:hypothetical protein